MSDKIRLTPEQGLESGILAMTLAKQSLDYMDSAQIELDVMINTMAVVLCGFVAQRERVIADSTKDVTEKVLDACVEIVKNSAINTKVPKPSSN